MRDEDFFLMSDDQISLILNGREEFLKFVSKFYYQKGVFRVEKVNVEAMEVEFVDDSRIDYSIELPQNNENEFRFQAEEIVVEG